MKNFSVEFELSEQGYRELSELTDRMVRMGASTGFGDTLRLVYEAGFIKLRDAVAVVEQQEQQGPRILLPH